MKFITSYEIFIIGEIYVLCAYHQSDYYCRKEFNRVAPQFASKKYNFEHTSPQRK